MTSYILEIISGLFCRFTHPISSNKTPQLLAFPFLRPGTVAPLGVPGGALPPPWKIQN